MALLRTFLVALCAVALVAGVELETRVDGVNATSDLRIIGGTEVQTPNPYPWAAFLLFGCPTTGAVASCTGSVISKDVVLTAGHCWMQCDEPVQAIVRIGADNTNPVEELSVRVHAGHPDYNPQTLLNDIALWIVDGGFTTLKEFAALPGGDVSVNTKVKAAGWGVTDNGQGSNVLREVTLEVQPNDICSGLFRGFDGSSQICAGVDGGGKDTCNGDSGGPLFSGRTVHGLTSYGSAQCGSLDGAVYTRISSFKSWISSTISDNQATQASSSSSSGDSTIWIILAGVGVGIIAIVIIAFIIIKRKGGPTAPARAGSGAYKPQQNYV